MAANLAIPDELIEEARRIGGHRTKSAMNVLVDTCVWPLALRR